MNVACHLLLLWQVGLTHKEQRNGILTKGSISKEIPFR